MEVHVIDPHAMQHDTDATRQRDHCPFRSSTAGNLRGQCSEPGQTAAVHHHGRSLAQSPPEIDVAGFCNPA